MATPFKPCSVPDCNGDARASSNGKRGMCSPHYKRWLRHGDPLAGARFRERQPELCEVEGCNRAAITRHLCGTHYARLRKVGSVGGPIVRNPSFGQCAVDGCAKQGRLHAGMCNGHYKRFWRYGDPKAGSTGMGVLLEWLRARSSYDGDGCLPWPFGRSTGGYGVAGADGVRQNASRIMCSMAHGEPPTPEHEAAHSCGKGHEGCVHPKHLRWATPAENQADRVTHGTDMRGEKHVLSKLTEAGVRDARRLKGVIPGVVLAKKLGVSPTQIYNVQNLKAWAWLD